MASLYKKPVIVTDAASGQRVELAANPNAPAATVVTREAAPVASNGQNLAAAPVPVATEQIRRRAERFSRARFQAEMRGVITSIAQAKREAVPLEKFFSLALQNINL